MIETHLNLFDAAVICILALSCLFAFFRGFVREVLSLGAWIGAAIVTIYYFPAMAAYLKPHFKSAVGAAGVGTLIIYTVALIGFSLINAVIIKFVRSGNDVGMLDNALGFMFGLGRGAFIISLGYFLMTIAMPEKEYPVWLKNSVTRPYAEMGAIKLAKVAPEYLREISTLEKKAIAEVQEAKKEEELKKDADKELDHYSQDSGKNKSSGSYSKASTNMLDRLINASSTSSDSGSNQ